jgi:hypothetical protein
MASKWSRIRTLILKNDAQIRIESWSPATRAKGVLQSAWFRVSGIPTDQRSIRTLAKVGGLVGKVIEIDEGSRYRYDYVRLKIACRNVARVPKVAESTLGMYLIDFGFEREVLYDGGERIMRSGIKVSEDAQPPLKKSKADHLSEKAAHEDEESDSPKLSSGEIRVSKFSMPTGLHHPKLTSKGKFKPS